MSELELETEQFEADSNRNNDVYRQQSRYVSKRRVIEQLQATILETKLSTSAAQLQIVNINEIRGPSRDSNAFPTVEAYVPVH